AISSGPTPSPARHATVLVIRSSSLTSSGARCAHYSSSFGRRVRRPGPRERNLPLAGENEDDDDDEHPEHAEEPQTRRRELESRRRTKQGHSSVPTSPSPVKLQKQKLLLGRRVTIVLEAMRTSCLTSALGLILPR